MVWSNYSFFMPGKRGRVCGHIQVARVLLIRTEKLYPHLSHLSLHPHSQYYRRQPDLYLAFSCNVLNLAHTPQKKDRAGWWRQCYKVGKQEGKKKETQGVNIHI